MFDTIAAIATSPGSGAIAIIRISGSEAINIAQKIFQGSTSPSKMQSRYAYFGKIVDHGKVIDEVLLTIFHAPKSYTGEDVVEVSGHGGAFIAARLLETILQQGARLARPGEFTQRAYLHGKMDLTQAEAVMDLITAQTEHAERVALEQRAGVLGQEIKKIRAELLNVVAHLEAFFDFPEDDISAVDGPFLRAPMERVRNHLLSLLATAEEGRLLREGLSLALCGAPNVGKSSLLNKLLQVERAIVSPTAGTTRDTIEEMATLGGFPFRVIDTAGIRITEDLIEREGVLRAQHAAQHADYTLHLVDATECHTLIEPIASHELLVLNKIDLIIHRSALEKMYPDAVMISCHTGEGLDALITTLIKHLFDNKGPFAKEAPSILAINARHKVCLKRALDGIEHALILEAQKEPLELLATELHAALNAIGEVTGEVNSEEILGTIFSTFCIGK